MLHYIEIKKKYPDTIIFYRLGDFYEMFFEDAVTASHNALKALTERAVTAGADNEVKAVIAGVFCRIGSIGTALSYMDSNFIASFVEFVYYLAELVADSSPSSEKIDNKIQFLHNVALQC